MISLGELTVEKAQAREVGADIVRIHKGDRGNLERWQVVRLTHKKTKKSKRVILLGHEKPGEIWLDIDFRTHWGLDTGEKAEFSIERLGFCGQVWMLAFATNPATRLPMQIALLLGGAGVFFGGLPYLIELIKWVTCR